MAQLQKKPVSMSKNIMLAMLVLVVLQGLVLSSEMAKAAPACQGTINALASACAQFASGSARPDRNCCGVVRSIKPATVACLCQNIPPGIGSSVISKIVRGCGVSGSFCGAR